ncbi:tRNA(Met) cytidine acetyltransferase TmcA domain-containing protein [Dongshaea marina]|uniref:tRNA(Met) cytidine acetyltransferase TmcA domain-containing protein n=1 Tax=Dongshaea marina TaxID=2047966 RepID=UPI000D3E8B09|nr:tRNA(Met) cytidine acetyltransferase TmcA domain-containing protein [Dongshaea marina]
MTEITYLQKLRAIAIANGHRYLVRLAGPLEWSSSLAEQLIGENSALWIENRVSPHSIPAAKARGELGGEYEWIVFNSFDGFHPDAFGSVSGTLKGGGLLLLLTPKEQQWQQLGDPDQERYVEHPDEVTRCHWHFIPRLLQLLSSDPGAFTLSPGRSPANPHSSCMPRSRLLHPSSLASLRIRRSWSQLSIADLTDARCLPTSSQLTADAANQPPWESLPPICYSNPGFKRSSSPPHASTPPRPCCVMWPAS